MMPRYRWRAMTLDSVVFILKAYGGGRKNGLWGESLGSPPQGKRTSWNFKSCMTLRFQNPLKFWIDPWVLFGPVSLLTITGSSFFMCQMKLKHWWSQENIARLWFLAWLPVSFNLSFKLPDPNLHPGGGSPVKNHHLCGLEFSFSASSSAYI